MSDDAAKPLADRPHLSIAGMLKKSVVDFWSNDCLSMAAALSYSTVFSLPALLILILTVAGLFVDPADVQEALQSQLGGIIGASGREQIDTILENARRPEVGFGATSLFGILFLIIGATGALVQLQNSLNKAWEVKPDPTQGGIKNFLMKRVLSFGMILGVAFLLLISLAISAAIAAVSGYMGRLMPGIGAVGLELINNVISFGVITVLFAAIFKFLPDAQIAWKDVWIGAAATTLLFVLGKFLMGLYLGQADPGEAFGAAASLAILLVWIYYASIVVLLGAEFTETWSRYRGSGIRRPEPGAVQVKEVEKVIKRNTDLPETSG